MLKKILLAVAVAAPMFMSAQAVKFGVINPQEIVNVMPDYATAQNTIKTVGDKYQTQAKALQDEYDKKMQEYQDLTKAKATEAPKDAPKQDDKATPVPEKTDAPAKDAATAVPSPTPVKK